MIYALLVVCVCLDGIICPRADISCVLAASKYLEDEKRIVCVYVCVRVCVGVWMLAYSTTAFECVS
jgi:hypothetical protein